MRTVSTLWVTCFLATACGGGDPGPAGMVGAASPGKADLGDRADAACGIVLLSAAVEGCDRSNCWLAAEFDVQSALLNQGAQPSLLYQGAPGSTGDDWSECGGAPVTGAPSGFQRYHVKVQVVSNPIEIIPFYKLNGTRVFDHNQQEGNYRLDEATHWSINGGAGHLACTSAPRDVADHSCKIILSDASLDGCARSNCSLSGNIDVADDVAVQDTDVMILYREQRDDDSATWCEGKTKARLDGSAPAGFNRFRFEIYGVPSNPMQIIPFYRLSNLTVFDHNRTEHDYLVWKTIGHDALYDKCVTSPSGP